MYYVYLLLSKFNGESYVGSTNDLRERVEAHNAGLSPSTKRHRPWALVYYETFVTRSLARVRERNLKHSGNTVRELKKRLGLDSPTRYKSGAGFTLIELLVVLSIMLVITGVFLVRNQQFNSAILLRSLSYQIALSIREAQVYGVGVREVSAGSGNFSAGYGVYFSTLTPSSYVLFADVNNSGAYDAGDTDVQNFAIGNGFTVARFCATTSGGVEQCAPDISALTITFRRPNPEPVFKTNLTGYTYGSASITASSPAGSVRDVSVGEAGEIAVKQTGN